jgi:hypothetical protein
MNAEAETLERLSERLEAASRLRAKVRLDAAALRKRELLRLWQAKRLATTHADLLTEPRFHAAAQFFLDEIYGPKDNAQRDADIARVAPTLVKVLPVAGLETVADAVELDALSEDLDAAMVAALGKRIEAIDAASYARAFRKVGRLTDRLRQADLVEDLGHALDRLTHRAFAGTALKMMGKPAKVAGLSELHAFLQTGYDAFRKMGKSGADEFLDRVLTRERAILHGLFAGDDSVLEAAAVA